MTTRLAKLAAALMTSAMTIGLAHAAELTCSGSDTKVVLQNIIDDNLTKNLNAQALAMIQAQISNHVLERAEQLSSQLHHKCDNNLQQTFEFKVLCGEGNLVTTDGNLARARAVVETGKNYVPVTVTPETIVTVDKEEHATWCKATLVSHGATDPLTGAAVHLPIRYSVEMTDDGQQLVTVYGIQQF